MTKTKKNSMINYKNQWQFLIRSILNNVLDFIFRLISKKASYLQTYFSRTFHFFATIINWNWITKEHVLHVNVTLAYPTILIISMLMEKRELKVNNIIVSLFFPSKTIFYIISSIIIHRFIFFFPFFWSRLILMMLFYV